MAPLHIPVVPLVLGSGLRDHQFQGFAHNIYFAAGSSVEVRGIARLYCMLGVNFKLRVSSIPSDSSPNVVLLLRTPTNPRDPNSRR